MIPLPQMIDEGKAAALASTMDAAQGASNTVALVNLFINIVLGASLKTLWGMINTLQFVVFFTDWNVRIPKIAQLGLKTFRVIALGEFIPTDMIM